MQAVRLMAVYISYRRVSPIHYKLAFSFRLLISILLLLPLPLLDLVVRCPTGQATHLLLSLLSPGDLFGFPLEIGVSAQSAHPWLRCAWHLSCLILVRCRLLFVLCL